MSGITSLVNNYLYPEKLAQYLCALLKYSTDLNKSIFDGIRKESSIEDSNYLSTLITHCNDYGYSVFRGKNQRFIFNNCIILNDFKCEKYESLFDINGVHLVASKRLSYSKGDEVDSIILIGTSGVQSRAYFVSELTEYIYIIDSNVSDDIYITLNGKEIYPEIITLPDNGVYILNYDINTGEKIFESGNLIVNWLELVDDVEYDGKNNYYFISPIDPVIENKLDKITSKSYNLNNSKFKYSSKNFLFSNNDVNYLVQKEFREIIASNYRYDLVQNIPWFWINLPESVKLGNLIIYDIEGQNIDTNGNKIIEVLGNNEFEVKKSANSLEISEFGIEIFNYVFSTDFIYFLVNGFYMVYSNQLMIIHDNFSIKVGNTVLLENIDSRITYEGNADSSNKYYVTIDPKVTKAEPDYSEKIETKINSEDLIDYKITSKNNNKTYEVDIHQVSYGFQLTISTFINSKSSTLEFSWTNGGKFSLSIQNSTVCNYEISGYDTAIENIVNKPIYDENKLGTVGIDSINNFSNYLKIYYELNNAAKNIFTYDKSNCYFYVNDNFTIKYELNYSNIQININNLKFTISNNGIYCNYYTDIMEIDPISESIDFKTKNKTTVINDTWKIEYNPELDSNNGGLEFYDSSRFNLAHIYKNKFDFKYASVDASTGAYEDLGRITATGTNTRITASIPTSTTTKKVSSQAVNDIRLKLLSFNTESILSDYDSSLVMNNSRLNLLMTILNYPRNKYELIYQFYNDVNKFSKNISRVYKRKLMRVKCYYVADKELSLEKISKFNEDFSNIMYNKLNCYFSFIPATDFNTDYSITIYFSGNKSEVIEDVNNILDRWELKIGQLIDFSKLLSEINYLESVYNAVQLEYKYNLLLNYNERIKFDRERMHYEEIINKP